MAGVKINLYDPDETDFTNNKFIDLINTITAQIKGLCRVNLINMETNDRPEIKAGSIIEISGELFLFKKQTKIINEVVDGAVYIKLVKDEDQKLNAEFTNSVPYWDYEKQGLYIGQNRFLPFTMTKNNLTYLNKQLYLYKDTGLRMFI